MTSLKEICQENITNSIYNMPPVLQEMIIGDTKKQMESRIREELKREITDNIIKEQENIRKEMLTTIGYIVPDIMNDIIYSMTHHNVPRNNYYNLFDKIERSTVDAAVLIAENAVLEMEERYVNNSFNYYRHQHDINYDNDELTSNDNDDEYSE